LKNYLYLFLILAGTQGCKYLYEPDAGIPAYLYIPGVTVSSVYALEGTSSHNVQDVWVYIDDEVQGIYQLPARIPILRTGQVNLRLNGGILLNGVSNTRAAYPHYAGFDTLVQLERGETDTIVPALRYNSNIEFVWKEDFELQGFTLRRNPQSDTTLIRTSDSSLVFEGSNSLLAYVDNQRPFFICETNTAFQLIRDGSNQFIEINYRNNVPLSVGYIAYAPDGSNFEQPVVVLNPSNSWKKQYINLTPFIGGNSGYTYRIIIAAIYNRTDGVTGQVQVDNLKLIR
jgi:hypothetical protein